MCSTGFAMTRLEINLTPQASENQRGGVIIRSPSAIIFDGIKAYVRQAIEDGDKLPNSHAHEPGCRAERRALIVAPVYREPGQQYGSLPSDAADVKLVHQMLLRFGYERQDIRILCDVCDGFNGRADPTRENIVRHATLQSVDIATTSVSTLVAESRVVGRGYYCRGSSFSAFGHGDRILGDSVNGKRARRVEPRLNVPGAWNIDTERSTTRVFSGRVTEQVVEEDELVYYNEGIEVRDEFTDGGYTDKILDSELNKYLSRLPEGCTITSIMDIYDKVLRERQNLDHKLLGSGFRGQHDTAIAQNQPGFFQGTSEENAQSSSSEVISASSSVASIVESTAPSISTAVCVMMKVMPRLMRYAREVMQEGIPDRERDLDNIKARI
ncbi:hypothetical protein FRC11_013778, partial [Ceratobasidium sp. 423]